MKTLLHFIAALFVVTLSAAPQFPPVLRQSLTTNVADNPSAAGQTPVWNSTKWIMVDTNSFLGAVTHPWTNFTAANSEGGFYVGIADTNDVASFASTFLTNKIGDFTTIITLGYGAGSPVDYLHGSGLINLGDFAGFNGAGSNITSGLNVGFFSGNSATLRNVRGIFNLSESAGGLLTLTNVNYMLNVGHDAGGSSVLTLGSEFYNWGYYAGGYTVGSNVNFIHNFGYYAGRGDGSANPTRYTNSAAVFNYGYEAGRVMRPSQSSNLYNYGSAAGSNAFVVGSGAIYNYGKEAGRLMRLTNCLNIYTFGTEAGTNIVMTAKTNVFLFGHVGPVAPENNDYYYGGPQTTNIYQGTVRLTNGAVANYILTSTDASGNAAWRPPSTGGETNSYWTNDTVVLKGTAVGLSPRLALRWGQLSTGNGPGTGIPIADFWNLTNVGIGTIGFGSNSLVRGDFSSVLGGVYNEIDTNSQKNVIAGGGTNLIRSGTHFSVIGGGTRHDIRSTVRHAVIGGGIQNVIYQDTSFATIAGGQQNEARTNHVSVGGGAGNIVAVQAQFGTIAGGNNNAITSDAGPVSTYSVIAGGDQNIIRGQSSFIGGGHTHQIGVGGSANFANYATIVGGDTHGIGDDSDYSFIGGGFSHSIGASATNSTIAGGYDNTISANATEATVGGGLRNEVQAARSAIPGGVSNMVTVADSWVIGNRTTNALAGSLDIGFSGSASTELTKSTFTATGVVIRAGLILGPSGTLITNVLTGGASLNFPDTVTLTHSDLPITVTGMTTNDSIELSVPFQAMMDGTCYTYFSSNDTVWVRFNNYSALSRNPPDSFFRAKVTKW